MTLRLKELGTGSGCFTAVGIQILRFRGYEIREIDWLNFHKDKNGSPGESWWIRVAAACQVSGRGPAPASATCEGRRVFLLVDFRPAGLVERIEAADSGRGAFARNPARAIARVGDGGALRPVCRLHGREQVRKGLRVNT